MSGKKDKQRRRENTPRQSYVPEKGHENDVRIGPLEKKGEKLLSSVDKGNMVAVLSKQELMYLFIFRGEYQCFIHKLDAEEGRHKSFEINERNRAMFKNLDSAADHFFEIEFSQSMDRMGVMVAAERGIINLLDSIGELPVEDVDFMQDVDFMDKGETPEEEGGEDEAR